jgi:hypothetical protein
MKNREYDFLETGYNRKIIIGLFVILALVLLGYNVSEFLTIYDTPLVGASYESRLASDKWLRLVEFDSEKKNTPWGELMEPLSLDPQIQESGVEENLAVEIFLPEQRFIRDVLPALSGVIRISGSGGKIRSAVIIGNKAYYEGDTVDGFYINEISENGVYLTKGKRDWFVDAPEVSYSVDRGY